jgi:hypothetical protein
MGCNCGSARRTARKYVLSYEDGSGRASSEHATKTDAEIKDAQNGGGGVIRPVVR